MKYQGKGRVRVGSTKLLYVPNLRERDGVSDRFGRGYGRVETTSDWYSRPLTVAVTLARSAWHSMEVFVLVLCVATTRQWQWQGSCCHVRETPRTQPVCSRAEKAVCGDLAVVGATCWSSTAQLLLGVKLGNRY